MRFIFRGALTRRMFAVYLALALLPTIAGTLVPAWLRIRAEEQSVAERSAEVTVKAEGVFRNLAINKASHFRQVVAPRIASAHLLADEAGRALADPQHAIQATGEQFNEVLMADSADQWRIRPDGPMRLMSNRTGFSARLSSEQAALVALLPAMKWVVGRDPVVRAAFVHTTDPAEWVYPASAAGSASYTLHSEMIRGQPPGAQVPETTIWRIYWVDERSVLSVAVPVWVEGTFRGVAGLDLWLDRTADQVYRYGLAAQATMLVLGRDTNYLAMPGWATNSALLGRFAVTPEQFLNRSLTEILPLSARAAVEAAGPMRLAAADEPIEMPVDLAGMPNYFVFVAVPDLPVTLLLVLPLEEIYNTASFYGASFRVTAGALLLQALIVGAGLYLVLGFGTALTLRRMAEPIHALAQGVQALARGDRSYRVPVQGHDELRDLATAFNAMVDVIQATEASLRRKQDELAQALAVQQAEFRAITEVAQEANRAGDLPTKLARTLQVAANVLPFHAGAAYLLEGQSRLLSVSRYPGGEAPPSGMRDVEERLASQAITLGRGVSEPIEDPHWLSVGRCTVVAAPICTHNRPIGSLVVTIALPEGVDGSSMTFLEALATHVAVLVENARLQQQVRHTVISEERRRLARELHDSVTQAIFALSLAAEGLNATLAASAPDEARQALGFLSAQAAQIRTELRALINELRPVELGSRPLEAALQEHAASVAHSAHLDTVVEIDGDTSALPVAVRHDLNRIVQEALSNVVRHAHARSVRLRLYVNAEQAELTVADDGCGFDLVQVIHERPDSLGLISMRERAELLGGRLSIESTIGQGTTVRVVIPLGSYGGQ